MLSTIILDFGQQIAMLSCYYQVHRPNIIAEDKKLVKTLMEFLYKYDMFVVLGLYSKINNLYGHGKCMGNMNWKV